MEYTQLSEKQRAEMLRNRIIQVEGDHANAEITKMIAQKDLEVAQTIIENKKSTEEDRQLAETVAAQANDALASAELAQARLDTAHEVLLDAVKEIPLEPSDTPPSG